MFITFEKTNEMIFELLSMPFFKVNPREPLIVKHIYVKPLSGSLALKRPKYMKLKIFVAMPSMIPHQLAVINHECKWWINNIVKRSLLSSKQVVCLDIKHNTNICLQQGVRQDIYYNEKAAIHTGLWHWCINDCTLKAPIWSLLLPLLKHRNGCHKTLGT